MYLSSCHPDENVFHFFANVAKPSNSMGLYAAQAKVAGRSLTTEEWEIDQQLNHEVLSLADVEQNPDALSQLSPLAYLYFLPAYLQAYRFLAWKLAGNSPPFHALTETLEGKSGPDRKKIRELSTPQQRELIVDFLRKSTRQRKFKTIAEIDVRLAALRFWLD